MVVLDGEVAELLDGGLEVRDGLARVQQQMEVGEEGVDLALLVVIVCGSHATDHLRKRGQVPSKVAGVLDPLTPQSRQIVLEL